MKIKIQIVVSSDNEEEQVIQEVAEIEQAFSGIVNTATSISIDNVALQLFLDGTTGTVICEMKTGEGII